MSLTGSLKENEKSFENLYFLKEYCFGVIICIVSSFLSLKCLVVVACGKAVILSLHQ